MIVNYRLKKQRIDPLDESVLEWLRDTRRGKQVIELFICTVNKLTDAMRHELLRTKKWIYMFDKLDQKIIISKTRKMC